MKNLFLSHVYFFVHKLGVNFQLMLINYLSSFSVRLSVWQKFDGKFLCASKMWLCISNDWICDFMQRGSEADLIRLQVLSMSSINLITVSLTSLKALIAYIEKQFLPDHSKSYCLPKAHLLMVEPQCLHKLVTVWSVKRVWTI